jgi:TatD DNase family protein
MFVDSHCHLNFPDLAQRLPEVLQAMADAQVHAAVCISTEVEHIPEVLSLAQSDARLWASVGVHPDTEPAPDRPEVTFEQLCAWATHPKVIAIGETGLDYYRLNGRSVADMAWQRERFRTHIRAARACRLPLVIHTRSASADTLRVLQEEQGGEAGGVFHCFTESMEVARAALDLGFYISFSGITTFKNAQALREVARFVPLERCLIETDSPYLAPVPHRGKSNQPAWVPHVAAELARQQERTLEEVAQATTANFDRLFGVNSQTSQRQERA